MFFFNISFIFFLIFLSLYLVDKRLMIDYFFLLVSLGFLFLGISFVTIFISQGFILFIIAAILMISVIVIPILVLSSGVALIFNGRKLIKNEGRRFHNLLSLMVGVCIILLSAMVILFPIVVGYSSIKPTIVLGVFLGICLIALYFLFIFVIFFTASFVYNFNRPFHNKDFIIILGSGLIGDKVPPLLANRIERGIVFYNKQKRRRKAPKFVVSGGKGADELISEAQAMKLYLLNRGIPESDIILEDKSTNTYENMKFSKLKMDSIKPKYKCVFVTNNFHLFRAGIYARKAKLRCDGIGSQTALYYLPNAFIREFIAILVMHKKVNVFIILSIVLLSLIFIFI